VTAVFRPAAIVHTPYQAPAAIFVFTVPVAFILANLPVSGGLFPKIFDFPSTAMFEQHAKDNRVHILKDLVDYFDENFNIPCDSPESNIEGFKECYWNVCETLNHLE